MLRSFLFVAALCCLSACATIPRSAAGEAAPPATVDRGSYRLNSGDHVRVDVFGEPDISVEATLEASGTINYPLLGRVVAGGLTTKELEREITEGLKDGYLVNPNVRVTIVQFRPIYLVGQVQHAGSFPYVEGLTVEKAIALAGGMTPLGSTRKMFIMRESNSPAGREKAELITPVLPGDTVMVEESLF